MNFQHPLPAVPENSVVTSWQPVLPQEFLPRLTEELLLARTEILNLRASNKKFQHESSHWRYQYGQLLAQYWQISQQNAALSNQNSGLKEQLRAARSRMDVLRTRRNVRYPRMSITFSPGSTGTVRVSDVSDRFIEEVEEDVEQDGQEQEAGHREAQEQEAHAPLVEGKAQP
ncbi:hypothetical protein FALBO_14086 [Fusarium albosuccineum]|uniref:Uncharacterized protein n=1 Tax=Fusarium albosuccineum TaxID=1237068 RepID=A0A8H4KX91_9HYPO|nr:hypothetical protein FALBO_14086 [Fusarium albosuccineum]KAF4991827.1 hypothetical protein FDECE_13904 [Fusarium decemcellulare]